MLASYMIKMTKLCYVTDRLAIPVCAFLQTQVMHQPWQHDIPLSN